MRSLNANWDIFACSTVITSKVICVQEIWSVKNINLTTIEGFNSPLLRERITTRGGGVGLYVRKGVRYIEIDTPFIEGILETIGIKCKINNKWTTIMSVYIPPGKGIIALDILKNWLSVQVQYIIAGDLNINTKRSTPTSRHFKHLCSEQGLKSTISAVTRHRGNSCIDHILVSKSAGWNYKSTILKEEIADHYITKLNITTYLEEKTDIKVIEYNNMSKENIIRFRRKMNEENFNELNGTIDENLDCIINSIKANFESTCPKIIRKLNKRVDCINKWMTKDLLKERNILISMAKKRNKSNYIHELRYKLAKREYQMNVYKARGNYINTEINEAKGDTQKLWKVLNNNCGLSKMNNQHCGIKIGNKLIYDSKTIAQEFSKYYKNEARRLKTTLNCNEDDHKKYLVRKEYTWSLSTVNREETMKIIKSLKAKKSSGYDGITNKVLKLIGDIVAQPLTNIINDCINNSYFPNKLKEAKVIPLYKKGAKEEVKNYRPISLLPSISKIFEKTIKIQLVENMEDNNILPITQFGFRTGMSTINAVENLVQNIQKAKREKETVGVIFVDVSKAFDCCDHKIILNKLRTIGLDTKGVKLFESYLSNRIQSVLYNGAKSDTTNIEIGVGQGTILGPILFNLYIHDLAPNLNCTTIQFADDTSLIITARNEIELKIKAEEELHKLYEWFRSNGLTINAEKTRFMQFNGVPISVMLNNTKISRIGTNENEKSFNLLGIEIDDKLHWSDHIQKIINKISKGTYMLYKFKKLLPTKTKTLLYNSFVMSHLRYGITIWGKARNIFYGKLCTINKKALRNLGVNKVHTEKIQKELKLLKICDLYEYEMSITAWKYLHNELPVAISALTNRNNRVIRLRRTEDLIVPRSLREVDTMQFDIKLCSSINNLSREIRTINKLNILKRYLKRKLLTKYKSEVNCTLPTCKECMLPT